MKHAFSKKVLALILAVMMVIPVAMSAMIFVSAKNAMSLPANAVEIQYLGCEYAEVTMLIAGDGKTVGEITAEFVGSAKDLNYFVLYVVDASNTITAIHDTIGRPDGIKTEVVCPEGGYILAIHHALVADEKIVLPEAKVGDVVTLYGADPADARGITTTVALEGAAFAVSAPIPEGAIAIDHAGYPHGGATGAVILAGDNKKVTELVEATYGETKDPTWWIMLIVDSNNQVIEIAANGVSKADVVCPEGGYILGAWSSNEAALNALGEVSVGDIITLGNVDLVAVRAMSGTYLSTPGWYFTYAADPNAPQALTPVATEYPTGFGNYTANLFDGVAASTLSYDNSWYAFYCNNTANDNAPGQVGTVTIDLGELCVIDSVNINTFLGNTSGIIPPKALSVEVSRNGENYVKLASKSFDKPDAGTNVVDWVELKGDEPVVGRYVKVTVNLMGVFAFVNEIKVMGKVGDKIPLPEDAVSIDYLGCNYAAVSFIIAGDDKTVSELTTKDLNYFVLYVVDSYGRISAVYDKLGRPDGVKSDVVCPAGGYIIAIHGNLEQPAAKAGDTIKLYNVDPADAVGKEGIDSYVALEEAGFIVIKAPAEWVNVVPPLSLDHGIWQSTAETDPQPEINASYTVKMDVDYIYLTVKVDRPWEYDSDKYQTGATNFRIWMLGDENFETEGSRVFFDVTLAEDGSLLYYLAKTATDKISAEADTSAETIDITFTIDKAAVSAKNALKLMVTYSSPYIAEEGKETKYNCWHITPVNEMLGGWSGNASMYQLYGTVADVVSETEVTVDGTNGTWQGDAVLDLQYTYSWQVTDSSINIATSILADKLSGVTGSFGNGAGTNLRIWFSNRALGTTTYTHFIDVSLRDEEVVARLLENTNPTGNEAAVVAGYDEEQPYSYKYKLDGNKLDIVLNIPRSVVGAEEQIEAILTVSNKPNGTNNALYSSTCKTPYSKWENASLVYSENVSGDVRVSHVNYYSWGAFNGMIITGAGNNCNNKVGQGCVWWVAIRVEKVGNNYVIAEIEGNGAEKKMTASDTGFILYVYSADKDYAKAAKAQVGWLVDLDVDLSTAVASQTPVGSINFFAPVVGDADGDGQIGSDDSMTLLQALVGATDVSAIPDSKLDLDGSGKVDIYDVVLLLRYQAGMILYFPCQVA